MENSRKSSSPTISPALAELTLPSECAKNPHYDTSSEALKYGKGHENSSTITLSKPESLVSQDTRPNDPDIERCWRRRHLIHYVTLCWCFFLEGFNDGSTGPLLPRIQSVYNVGPKNILARALD